MSAIPKQHSTSGPTKAILCHILTPVGMLGYGFDPEHLEYGLETCLATGHPTAIILDSGSTDSGPSKLALGSMTCPRSSYENDLERLIQAVLRYKVPLLIGSVGGDGSAKHVDEFNDILTSIMERQKASGDTAKLEVLKVYSDISKDIVLDRLQGSKIVGCGNTVPELKADDVASCPTIVAQMGPEALLAAMMANPDFDVLIAGRAYDPAPYVAYCMLQDMVLSQSHNPTDESLKLGAFTHMGKIMECGGLCATPKSRSAMATVYSDSSFDITPLDPASRCTPLSVAAHTLYEKARPDILYGPGGYLDVSPAKYQSLSDGRTVRVHGSQFILSGCENLPYRVKLEGAKVTGYRTMFMGSFVDPILQAQLPDLLKGIKKHVAAQHSHISDNWSLDFHLYGNGHHAEIPVGTTTSNSILLVGEAMATSQTMANSLASSARIACLHGPYPGQKATSGNFGMGLGGMMEIEAGPCAEFALYHLMELLPGEEISSEIQQKNDPAGTTEGNSDALFTWSCSWIGHGDRVQRQASEPINHTEAKQTPVPMVVENEPELDDISTLQDVRGTIGTLAKVIRSKNAGPYEITFDIMFDDASLYEAIKRRGVLNAKTIADLYNMSESEVIYCGFFDPALAFKATIPRKRNGRNVACGGFMENDVHGSQAYVPLFMLQI